MSTLLTQRTPWRDPLCQTKPRTAARENVTFGPKASLRGEFGAPELLATQTDHVGHPSQSRSSRRSQKEEAEAEEEAEIKKKKKEQKQKQKKGIPEIKKKKEERGRSSPNSIYSSFRSTAPGGLLCYTMCTAPSYVIYETCIPLHHILS